MVLLVSDAKETKLKTSTYTQNLSTRREMLKLWTKQRTSHLESNILLEQTVVTSYLFYFNKSNLLVKIPVSLGNILLLHFTVK